MSNSFKPSHLLADFSSIRLDLLLFISFGLLAFGRCLFLGQAYFDNDLLQQFGPWRMFLRDQLAQGHFPLWNPYLFMGQPFFADLQNMMAYPFNYPTLLFPVPYGLSVFFFLHMLWAAWGMRLWLGSLALSPGACRVGALAFASSNFFWWEIIHPPVLAAYAWLPWVFLFLEKTSKEPKPRRAFWAGLSFAMLFLCGSFQVSLGVFYGGATYFLVRYFQNGASLQSQHEDTKARRKANNIWGNSKALFLSLLILIFLWGALPLLAQFIPTLEFSSLSNRSGSGLTYAEFNSNLSLQPGSLYQFFFPRLTLPDNLTLDAALQSHETVDNGYLGIFGYVGVWLPWLLVLAFTGKDKKVVFCVAGISIAVLTICFGKYFFLHRFLCDFVPGFSLLRVPFRFIYLYVLGACFLLAAGFHRLEQETESSQKLQKLVKTGLLFALALYLVSLLRFHQTWRETLALVAGASGLALCALPGLGKKWGLPLFQAALILPLLLTGWSDFETGPPSNFDFSRNTPPDLKSLLEKSAPSRTILDHKRMPYYPLQVRGKRYIVRYPQNAACALKVRNLGGYNPLTLRNFNQLLSLPLDTLVGLSDVGRILSSESRGPLPGFSLTRQLSLVDYERQEPPRHVFTSSRIEVIPDEKKRLEFMRGAAFRAGEETILDQPLPPEVQKSLPAQKARLQYQWVKDEPDLLAFNVELDKTDLVVFSETAYPGWKAKVDGHPVPIFPADHLLRSLVLPAGRHEVEFSFEPAWWKPLCLGLLLWAVLTTAFFLLYPRLTGRSSGA